MAASRPADPVEQAHPSLQLNLLSGSEAVQYERTSSDTKRKNRKYRYRKQGYHKTERENARRVEARNFLSGITLDSHYRTPVEAQEQDPALLPVSSKHSASTAAEDAMTELSQSISQGDEMASLYELYSHHSPVKLAPSRSQEHTLEHTFDHLPHNLINRSTSLHDAVTTPSYEHRKTSLHHVGHTKSLGSSLECGGVHYLGRLRDFPVDSRYKSNYSSWVPRRDHFTV